MTELATQTWPEVVGPLSLLVVPLGATEQHGPHLPLSTDTVIAQHLTDRLVLATQGVSSAPAVPYGASGEHQSFPGTLSIGQEALELLLVELGRSARVTFQRLLFVSAHGGNAEPVGRAVTTLQSEGQDAHAWSPAVTWHGDAHAGRVETSVMLALKTPGIDMKNAARGNSSPIAELLPKLRSGGVAAVSANGVLGDPSGANPKEGNALLESAADELIAAVRDWPKHSGVWL